MREDWVECKLGDISYKITDGSHNPPAKKDSGQMMMLSARNIFDNKIDYENVRFLSREDFDIENRRTKVVSGDILLTIVATIGRSAVVKNSDKQFVLQRSVAVIGTYINSFYLNYYLKSQKSQAFLWSNAKGTAQKGIYLQVLSTLPVIFPSTPEQQAIVEKMENLFSSLDAGVADLKKAQKQLKIYRQAVLKKAFEGELTKKWRSKQNNLPDSDEVLKLVKQERENYYNSKIKEWENAIDKGEDNKRKVKPQRNKQYPKISNDDYISLPKLPSNWGWDKFGNVCLKIMDGTHFSPNNVENGDYKYITAKNIKEGRIDLKKLSFVTKEDHSVIYARCDVKKGDILYIKDGATAGIAAVNHFDEEFSLLSSVGVFRTSHSVISPKFLEYYLNAQITKNRMLSNISGVAITRLTLVKLNNSIFVICSPQEQNEIVKQIESRLSVCDSIEQNIKESLEKAESLRQSILKKAFEGNLLTAEELAKCKLAADYEPASVLLERIKAEQSRVAAKPNKRKTVKPLIIAKQAVSIVKVRQTSTQD